MLGAGKTTFIRNFTRKAPGRTVVLVNDFGKAGIDGEVFEAGGIESIELPSGCVCCTLKFDLIATIEKIIGNLFPDHLIIEPSGVASPSGVLEALDILKINAVTVVGIIDATEFLELYEAEMFGRFFEDQVLNSDIILVNKADLAGDGMVRRTLRAVELMNPGAIVFQAVNCLTAEPVPEVPGAQRIISSHAHNLHFDTVSVRLGSNIGLESISSLFHDMATGRYGDIVRAKALVNTTQGSYKFDLSFTNVKSTPFERPVSGSRLVVIGRGLKKDLLAELTPGIV
jgi:G3E family GTPase